MRYLAKIILLLLHQERPVRELLLKEVMLNLESLMIMSLYIQLSEVKLNSLKENGVKEYPFNDEDGKYRLEPFQASGSDATRKLDQIYTIQFM